VTGDKVVLAARYLQIHPQILCFNEKARGKLNKKATGAQAPMADIHRSGVLMQVLDGAQRLDVTSNLLKTGFV
jgi:hypothetical protein